MTNSRSNRTTIVTGDHVRYAKPNPDEDPNQLYRVIEERGDRVLITPIGEQWLRWTIPPMNNVPIAELVRVS